MHAMEPDPGTRERSLRFAASLVELDMEIDWDVLGEAYCHEGGAGFFPIEQREAMREAGLRFASDVANGVEELGEERLGRSLYVGAAVAELAPILCESVVLEREVVAISLASAETAELNRALAAVEERVGLLPRIDTRPLAQVEGAFDHVWMVSVLTDPDAFPALHDHLYERVGTELATGRGDLERDRGRAIALTRELVQRLQAPSVLTTSDEEFEFVAAECSARGWTLEVPERARLSGVVGDPVRVCRVLGS